MDEKEKILQELNEIENQNNRNSNDVESQDISDNEDTELQEREIVIHTIQNGEAPKKIEVVTGNGDLTISPVYRHLEVEKPKPKDNKQKIFIPEVKNTQTNSDKDENQKEQEDENPLKTTLIDDTEEN